MSFPSKGYCITSTKTLKPSMWYLKAGCFVRILFFQQYTCSGVTAPMLDTVTFLLHVKKLRKTFLFHDGKLCFSLSACLFLKVVRNVSFPHLLVNFSLVSNQSGSCRQFGWWFSRFTGSFGNLQFKYFTEWSFLGWCHFELAQINFLPWKLYNKHSTFKKEPANGSLEHSKGNILKTN